MPDESETVPIERFADEPGPAGEAIGMYRETLRRGAPEAVAWKRLEGRMRKPRALRPLPLAAFAGALFATLLLLWRTMVDHPTIAPTSERAGSDRSSIQEPTANPGVELSVGAVPVRIPYGALRISPTLDGQGGPPAYDRVALFVGQRTSNMVL